MAKWGIYLQSLESLQSIKDCFELLDSSTTMLKSIELCTSDSLYVTVDLNGLVWVGSIDGVPSTSLGFMIKVA